MPWPFLIPIAAILGGCTVAIVGMISRARIHEAEIRERIAMIERGLVPPPEKDPQGFDRAMGHDSPDPAAYAWSGPSARYMRYEAYRRRYPGKHRRGGFVMIGIGVGLIVMFSITGETDGIGIGGLLAIIGLALFLSSFFDGPDRDRPSMTAPSSSPANPSRSSGPESP